MLTLSPQLVRRLAITKQRLAGARPAPNAQGIMEVVRNIRCLQIDPISAVARSHQLVLFSRLGKYDLADLDTLLWNSHELFEYWAHCASIVLTEDYPLFKSLMTNYPWSPRTIKWLAQNKKLRSYVLAQIKKRGPLLSRDLEESGVHPKEWVSTGWTSGRNISRMLDILWIGGTIMVAQRDGIQKAWDLSERCLPNWTPRQKITERQRMREVTQLSLRALGVATPTQINFHFTRGNYPNLPQTLRELEQEKIISQVTVADQKGTWYIHNDDLPLLDTLQNGAWQPRTTLLSPFDNLICDRKRTESLFDFYFRIEIYVPEKKRQYGYYVLPILHGDELIGRIDPKMDRATHTLHINAVYAEPTAPKNGKPIKRAIEDLAEFLGAIKINYTRKIPTAWKKDLR
jgi:uncharacterized protein YcaQ